MHFVANVMFISGYRVRGCARGRGSAQNAHDLARCREPSLCIPPCHQKCFGNHLRTGRGVGGRNAGDSPDLFRFVPEFLRYGSSGGERTAREFSKVCEVCAQSRFGETGRRVRHHVVSENTRSPRSPPHRLWSFAPPRSRRPRGPAQGRGPHPQHLSPNTCPIIDFSWLQVAKF